MKPRPSLVLFVRDVKRVAEFYLELAAMKVLSGDDDHVVLGVDGFELVVHRLYGEPEPARDTSGQVQVREDSYSKLCLPVASIEQARTLAKRLGGGVKPEDCGWSARGFRACDGHDPEGNVIQVRQAGDDAVVSREVLTWSGRDVSGPGIRIPGKSATSRIEQAPGFPDDGWRIPKAFQATTRVTLKAIAFVFFKDGKAGWISLTRNPVFPGVRVRSGAKTGTGTRSAALRREPVPIFSGFCDVPSLAVIRYETRRNRFAKSDTGSPGSTGTSSEP